MKNETTGKVTGIDSKSEKQEVGKVLAKIGKAFSTLDASLAADCYTENADWTNAFGTTLKGRDEILCYLEKLLAQQQFKTGAFVSEPQATIRIIGNGVAVAKTYAEREGQYTQSGEPMEVRRNFSLKVLVKRNGKWKIISDMYMDARDDKTLNVESG
ncbi:SgcJ/EcaC family oxidoreductase [Fodinibius halophilus]|uniref:SgcJ/EcaC family oxidoreductase n=1 Tax=Fodinibius halophilus TaxID=1736908 RepID=A0A6M1T6B7_9BACT|nr:SgcJ/EcaC family oxidoreductase [Fodinibius halophilus]NGP89647.1 SgcJ/EcaC family oxidoreductase [Fodinibius halophilus]